MLVGIPRFACWEPSCSFSLCADCINIGHSMAQLGDGSMAELEDAMGSGGGYGGGAMPMADASAGDAAAAAPPRHVHFGGSAFAGAPAAGAGHFGGAAPFGQAGGFLPTDDKIPQFGSFSSHKFGQSASAVGLIWSACSPLPHETRPNTLFLTCLSPSLTPSPSPRTSWMQFGFGASANGTGGAAEGMGGEGGDGGSEAPPSHFAPS